VKNPEIETGVELMTRREEIERGFGESSIYSYKMEFFFDTEKLVCLLFFKKENRKPLNFYPQFDFLFFILISY
jgi:hypothetical protein